MKPLLVVELNDYSYKNEVDDLRSGLVEAMNLIGAMALNEATYAKVMQSLGSTDFSVTEMKRLREVLPELRVTGHFLTIQDSAILDRS